MSFNHFLFSQIDTWFFRESRSMDGSGSVALDSIFPPSSNTLLGSIRTQIGEKFNLSKKISWSDFEPTSELAKIIGYGRDYAKLRTQGPWLYNEGEKLLYFKAPLNMYKKNEGNLGFFQLGNPLTCDLGNNVVLPEIRSNGKYEGIDNEFISSQVFNEILNGKAPLQENLIDFSQIVKKEYRLGIACNIEERKTIEGKLYQTNHIRLDNNWSIYQGVTGINQEYLPNKGVMRLGGEARMADFSITKEKLELPKKPIINKAVKYLIIYLISPLPDLKRNSNHVSLPNSSFKKKETTDETQWIGKIGNLEITIVSAIIGKSERIGGWDMVKHQSSPVKSFLPAGSCWYIKLKDNDKAQNIVENLHGKYLTTGSDKALGYGQIVVGVAPTK